MHALVLAAGAGTRMGGGKLRRLWRGRPLLAWSVEAALPTPVDHVWVVLGADLGAAALLPQEARLSVVQAPAWEEGLSASLRAGLAALPIEAGAALVFLGDMPRVPSEAAPVLVDAWRGGAIAAAPTFEGRRGHPVLLDRSLFARASAAEGDRGAGPLLASLGGQVALIPVADEGVLYDVDTVEALEA